MSYYDRTYRFGFGGGITTAIKYLLIVNGVIFVLQYLAPNGLLFDLFGMKPSEVIGNAYIWQLFTYMFLHDGPWHIIFNMFFLWMFGCEVERTLGTREFVKYYFICGVGAALFHLVINYGSPIPVVGASGAIYGVMAAFAVLFPERVITLLLFLVLPVQIKAKYLVMIFAGISLLVGTLGNDNVAHFAHLGGMLVGFLYLKLDWRLDYVGTWLRQQRESRKVIRNVKRQQAIQHMRERVDEILDKINEVGYDALNDDEKQILRDASQRLGQEEEAEN